MHDSLSIFISHISAEFFLQVKIKSCHFCLYSLQTYVTWGKQFDLVIKAMSLLLKHFAFSQPVEKRKRNILASL